MDKLMRKRTHYKKKGQQSPNHDAKLQKILLGIFFLFVVIWAVLGIMRSDLFNLQQVVIEGNNYTQETEIKQALQLTEGENILKMSLSQLRERILTIPRIESVQVRRRLPNKLHVVVTERKMLVLVPYQEYFLEIGANGQIIGTTVDSQNHALPLLTGLAPVATTVGESVLEDKLLDEVKELSTALSDEGIMVSEINVARDENLILVTMDGLIVWAGNKNFAEKTRILVQIIGQLSGRQGDGYLDLRVSSAPAFHIIEQNP